MSTYLVPFAFILLISSPFLISGARVQPGIDDDDNPYRHTNILDPEGKFKLDWLINWEEERIYFNVTVETTGFVLIGLSKRDPNNINVTITDHVVAGVDWKGRPYLTDLHSDGNDGSSLVDVQQDSTLLAAKESRTHTFISAYRPLVTCDPHDFTINDNSVDLYWAYGDQDLANPRTSDFVSSGLAPIYLLDPDLTPRDIQQGRLTQPETQLAKGDVKVWSIRRSLTIPPKRTTYWCNIRKLTLSRKHHVMGFNWKVNNESRLNIHHTMVYRCIAPNAASLYERLLDHPGEECYSQDQQLGEIPFHSCIERVGGLLLGGYSLFLPDSMGIPIGTTGQSEYYLIQSHYDNPELRRDIRVDSQFDVYYTSRLRPNDGGFISIGHNYPGSPSLLLPPRTTDHKILGHCSPTCTRKMIPEKGIKIVASILHSHGAARRVTLQHFRGNQELPHILNDDNYRTTYQPARLLRKERTILPGDQITTRCYYDTTYSSRTIVGGYGADREMCKTYSYYYNQITNYVGTCRSELISPEYTATYLAGTRNLTWDQSRLEFVATDPRHLAGMTVSQISDSPYVKWSPEQRARLKRDQIVLPQTDVCPSIKEYAAQLKTNLVPKPTFVSYPVQATEYRPQPECSLLK